MSEVTRDKSGRVVSGRLNASGANQYSYKQRAQQQLDEALRAEYAEGGTVGEAIIKRVLEDALDGDSNAMRLVWSSLVPKLDHQERVQAPETMAAEHLEAMLRSLPNPAPDEAFGESHLEGESPRGSGRDYDA